MYCNRKETRIVDIALLPPAVEVSSLGKTAVSWRGGTRRAAGVKSHLACKSGAGVKATSEGLESIGERGGDGRASRHTNVR